MTYNGHGMEEFVAQKTSAYVSQHDLHIGEMTVRETLAFSARCQGVGTHYGQPQKQFLQILMHSKKNSQISTRMLYIRTFIIIFFS